MAFAFQSPLSRAQGRPGFDSLLGFFRSPADPLNESLRSVLPVSLLSPETPCIDEQNAFFAHSLSRNPDKPSPHIPGQGRGPEHIEPQLDRSSHFVHILASWP
jgi:hypothetical protein